MAIPQAELEQCAAKMSKLVDEWQRLDEPAFHHIHVDLDTVADTRLGTLLSMIATDEDYRYILSQLDTYEAAYDRRVAKYFPKLGINEEQLQKQFDNPDNHRLIAAMAPFTRIQKLLLGFLDSISIRNQISPDHNDQPITLHFWHDTITVPPGVRVRLCKTLFDSRLPVVYSFHQGRLEDATANYIDNVAMWIVDDISRFNRCERVNTAMCTNVAMCNRVVLARKQVKDQFLNMSSEELEKGLGDMAAGMNILCEFAFFKHHILRENE